MKFRLRIFLAALFLATQAIAFAAYQPAVPSERDVDKIVDQAAAAFFQGDSQALRKIATDPDLPKNHERLSVLLNELSASIEVDRDERVRLADELARSSSLSNHTELRDRLRQEDPLLQAEETKRRQQWNRLVTPVNFISRSFFSLIQGNTQVLLSWAVEGANRLRYGKARNEWDRKLADLYNRHLKQNPSSETNGKVKAELETLKSRDQRLEANELVVLSILYRNAGYLEDALFYAEQAEGAGASGAGAAKLKASQEISRRYRGRDASYQFVEDKRENENMAAINAMIAGESSEINRLAAAEKDESRKLFLQAVGAKLNGDPGAARQLLETTANGQGADPLSRHARNLDRSLDANPKAAWTNANSQAAREKTEYIFFDEWPARDRIAAAQTGGGVVERGILAKTISAVFFPDSIVRGIKTAFGKGPSHDPTIDAAAQWVKAEPNSERAADLQSYLAKQAEKQRDYTEAQQRLAQSGKMEAAKQAKLREKQARDLFARIQAIEDLQERQKFLTQAQSQFAGTSYEKRAVEEAKKLQEKSQLVFAYDEMKAMNSLQAALGWPPVWFDGILENRELGQEGAVFVPPDFHEVIVYFELPDNTTERRRQIVPQEKRARVQAILADYRNQKQRMQAAESLTARRYLPLDIQGGIGGEGMSVYPSIQSYQMPVEEKNLYR